jgi:hypothetical protein
MIAFGVRGERIEPDEGAELGNNDELGEGGDE